MRDICLQGLRHRFLQIRDFRESVAVRDGLVLRHLALVPVGGSKRRVELSVLPREVLVMKMEPIVVGQFPVQHFGVPKFRVGNLRVLERKLHGVVPGRRARRDIDRHARRRFEFHRLHVVVGYLGLDLRHAAFVHDFDRHPADQRLIGERSGFGKEERAAPIVEEPFAVDAATERPIDKPVRAEMIGLRRVHRDQHARGGNRRPRAGERGDQQRQHGATDRRHGAPEFSHCGIRFRISSARMRASGATGDRG